MAINRIYGIETIKIGACGSLGTMGSSLTAVDKLKRDSVNLEKAEPETFELLIEESTSPDFEALTDSKALVFTFETYNVTPENMVLAFGGVASTSLKYVAPVTDVMTEKSVEIKTKPVNGYYTKIEIPRASVKAALVAPLQRGAAGTIRFTIKALIPEGAAGILLPPYTKTQVVYP